jgi:hypothetical protein
MRKVLCFGRMHELRERPCPDLDHATNACGLLQCESGMIKRYSDIFAALFG